jgi:iron complex transport system substrate-binding protein
VASLVPAATDLIVGMGATDHLGGISNYDVNRPETDHLPRVGDYQSVDWERLNVMRPDVLIIFQAPDRVPAGMRQKAESLGIRLVDAKAERVADVFDLLDKLGETLNEPRKAADAQARLRRRLDEVARRVAGMPRVRTLIVMDTSGRAVAGPDTFLDDLLQVAGGQNAAASIGSRYPEIDREKLIELAPDAVIQLLPDASRQVLEQARQNWEALARVPAVREGRVEVITQWYAVQPGWHMADLAEQMAEALHPSRTNGLESSPTTRRGAAGVR